MTATSLAEIIGGGTRFVARSWLVLSLALFLRLAAAVAGFLPWIFAIVLIVRFARTAPIDPAWGLPDIWDEFLYWAGEPDFLPALAGVLAAAWAIRFFVTALVDAGLFAALADAAAAGRAAKVGAFIDGSLAYAPRVAALRVAAWLIQAGFAGLFAALGAATAAFFANRAGGADIAGPNALFVVGGLMMGLPAAFLAWAVLMLWQLAACSALVVERQGLAHAMAAGWRHLRRRGGGVLALAAFAIVLSLWLAVFSFAGDVLWLKAGQAAPGLHWPQLAASAWSGAFIVAGECLWMLLVYSQTAYYRATRLENNVSAAPSSAPAAPAPLI
ncbi:MAG: hypothetical protein C4523_18055 [Myxococcales bacterium]|nr:MAG: hypothetical protein C4523_18055 [Myxococcales bacterium]